VLREIPAQRGDVAAEDRGQLLIGQIRAVVSLALIPVALEVEDALGALAIAAGGSAALIAYEVIHFAEGRATLRAGARAR
jgi:hypothetical protein